MGTLANREDPDEMHNAAFHQGIHCLLKQKLSLEFITCDPLIYTMDHPKSNVSSQKQEIFTLQWFDLTLKDCKMGYAQGAMNSNPSLTACSLGQNRTGEGTLSDGLQV